MVCLGSDADNIPLVYFLAVFIFEARVLQEDKEVV